MDLPKHVAMQCTSQGACHVGTFQMTQQGLCLQVVGGFVGGGTTSLGKEFVQDRGKGTGLQQAL